MKNIITASIEFYFKGEKYSPTLTLELDDYMQASGSMPDLYPLIAAGNNIDLYSYEYEIMQAEPIRVADAQGLVANFVANGALDTTAFELAWQEQLIRTTIRQIVTQHGHSHILEQYPEFEQTLIEIYRIAERNVSNSGI